MDKKKLLSILLAAAVAAAGILGYTTFDLSGKLTAMTDLQAQTAGTLDSTEGKLAETEATLASTQTTLTETEGKLAETEAALASSEALVTELDGNLTAAQTRIHELEEQIIGLEERIAEYEAAAALAAKEGTVEFTDICGYHIGVPGHYTRHTVSDDSRYYYYYYGDAGDFIMIMPFDMTAMGAWVKDPAVLPEVYALTYQSITDAAGSSAASTYRDITVNGAPAVYGECAMSGISTDYVLYYDASLPHMMIVCYANVTNTYESADILQVVIDNTSLTVQAPAEVPAEEPVEEPVELPAEEPAEPFARVELNGYSIALPSGYTNEKVSDGTYFYYYFGSDSDFVMIMPFDVSSFDSWMLSETFLPYVYELCYESVAEAAGSTAGSSYTNITINNSPAGYGKSDLYGAKLDYVLYYAQGMDDMMVIAYTNVNGHATGEEMLQVTIDNTCLVGQVPMTLPADEPVAEEQPAVEVPAVQAGDIITYGRYEQDNKTSNGPDPVRWVVLTVEGNKALVVTEQALCGRLYHDRLEPVTWETCSLRTWMNTDLLLDMFYDEEQVAILSTKNTDPKAPGVESNDLLFLLSVAEVEEYLNNSTRNIYPTKYATKNGAAESKLSGLTWWWLRSPGESDMEACYISNSTLGEEPGKIKSDNVNKYYAAGEWTGAVRPAMWVDLTKLPAEAFE